MFTRLKDILMGKRSKGGGGHNNSQVWDSALFLKGKCEHPALAPIKIAGHDVWFGACLDISEEVTYNMDYVVALNHDMVASYYGQVVKYIICPLQDYGGVPACYPDIIKYVVSLIKEGHKVLSYCTGGHGRTGTFGASLISVMEPDTPDPIDAMRERHCYKAVETHKQATAVFQLRDKALPARYEKEFYKSPSQVVVPTKGGTKYSL